MIRLALLTVVAAIIFARPMRAQERCDAATVRRLSPASVPDIASPDIYFNVQIGKPPVVGAAALDTLARLHGSERRNEKPHEYTILQLSTSADGSMAYDDGTVRVEFDDVATRKHVIYDVTYLRVWKVVAGKCRMAASYGRRGDLEGQAGAR
jgi:hypothetical protein